MKTEIVKQNGVNYIAIDGKIVDVLSFKSFRPTKNNVSDFYKAGIRIFHVYCSGLPSGLKIPYSLYGECWFGDGDYRFEGLDRQIEMFIENAPDGYVFINVHLDVREWWLKENPGRSNSFTHLSQIAADEKWRRDTAEYLKALILHVEGKYDDKVVGYFLLGGHTTEWFSDLDYEESHPIKLRAFREYMNDDSVEIPKKEVLEKPSTQIFLDPVKDKTLIEYRKFHANLISDLVLYYCHEAQEVLCHKKLMGVFFGYIMELLDERLWNAGHLALDKVYRSPDIDYIATPSSYQFRKYEDAGAYMLLTDTLELNNIMYFCSFDHLTFKIPTLPSDPRRICGEKRTQEALEQLATMRSKGELLATREQTTDAIYREFMLRMAKRSGMWWFDMLEGWFYDDKLMADIGRVIEKSGKLMPHERHSASEIAVFVSSDSLYYVNKCSQINTETICNQRDALAKMGAPYDLFSLNDIDRVELDKYKLVIFTDAFLLTDEQRKIINETVKSNSRTVLFIGGCDYTGDDGLSLERVSKLTEMDVDILDTDEAKITAFGSEYGYKEAKHPTMYSNDPDAEILGRYETSGAGALLRKKKENYTVYYSGLGNLSQEALTEIARESGVHLYAKCGIATFVNSGFVGVYNTKDEFTEVILKEDGEFTEIFSEKTYKTKNRKIMLPTGKCPAQMLILSDKKYI